MGADGETGEAGMKFNCGPSLTERLEAREQWHRWFAWRPVRVGPRDCRWLEMVERRVMYNRGIGFDTEYRGVK